MRYLLSLLVFVSYFVKAQPVSLAYYLPPTNYNPAIPTPASVLGFPVGEQHAEPSQMAAYYRALAAASPRVTLEEYGRTYEQRPLYLLTITTEANQQNITQLQAQHLAAADPGAAPVVVWLGYSVHGNEPSGANAALLVAYYLAAAPAADVAPLLEQTIVLMDPFINPDGLNRFATWANTHKGQMINADPPKPGAKRSLAPRTHQPLLVRPEPRLAAAAAP